MKYSVDRFESDKAVLINELGESVVIDIAILPNPLNEGDLLEFENGEYKLLKEETVDKRKELHNRIKRIFK